MVFHVHNDYVTQQAKHFGFRKQSGGLTTSWDDPKTARAAVSPTFHTDTGETATKFENAGSRVRADQCH